MWIAYPLYKSTCNGTSEHSGDWVSTPGIAESDQINIWDRSYNVYYGDTEFTENFVTNKEYYSRGHQIPDADRKYNETMVQQTYYAINSTPQIQQKFNGSIWSSLETAIRKIVINNDETVFVVTGPAFQKIGESEKEVKWILPSRDSKRCPVPNFYWKALLRVRKASDGTITASSIGFWFEHKQYDNSNYSAYAYSVNDIERWTGFNLFEKLPASIQETVESNSNWQTFQNF